MAKFRIHTVVLGPDNAKEYQVWRKRYIWSHRWELVSKFMTYERALMEVQTLANYPYVETTDHFYADGRKEIKDAW